jgi:GntR family transcriptional regulator, transcriptional repressor for pyruvate dehydrogenase complex
MQEWVNLGDVLYTQLAKMLAKGDFPKGSRLPAEAELAARFRVSRPTVREALGRLRHEGLISSRRGSGSYVLRRPDAKLASVAPLGNFADIEHCFSFRRCIEAGAAESAAKLRDQSDLEMIRAAHRQFSKAVKANATSIEEDLRFHLAIAHASRNPFFISAMEMTKEHVRLTIGLARRLSLTQDRLHRKQALAEHQAILEAIVDQSPERAFEAMRRHIENAKRRIFEGATE